MALLGSNGHGYDLALRLETCGVWRAWLGDSSYAAFAAFLASQSSWDAFMGTDDSKSRAQIQLQLRVRALLFDKASVSLFLRSSSSSSASAASSVDSAASNLNSAYLQLHGDDVYFSLEDFGFGLADGAQAQAQRKDSHSKSRPRLHFGSGSKYGEPDGERNSDARKHDEFPETWYSKFIERYKATKQNKLQLGDRESLKRTAEGMSKYIRLLERHKKSRFPFKGDHSAGVNNSVRENGLNTHHNSVSEGKNADEDEGCFFPEMLFQSNCVPESALPPITRVEENSKIEYYGILDSLPHVMARSPAMLERFGIIRQDYHRVELGRSKYRGKNGLEGNGKLLGQDQALKISQKVIARVLSSAGFEGASEVPMEVLSQFLSCYVCKLGRILKVLTDSYRKQCSSLEILKMFLQTTGHSNFGALVEHVKDGNRNIVNLLQQQQQQTQQPQQQQHIRGLQAGFQSQPHQNAILTNQQIPMQIHPQTQMQMGHSPNIALQQQQQQQQQQQLQWERMRRRQPTTPRAGMNADKDRPMVEVKVENTSESPLDANTFASINNRQPQMQFRQQQMAAAMATLHAQSSIHLNNWRRFTLSSNNTFCCTPRRNMVTMRAPPVKVEGFQELMGGDATLKHDPEDHKLTSPSK
ncbi:hypothetical protein Syun_015483 [Stephania yunnanensis]|uniref:Bromodomain associated domain-containing protein n=1 Tax=Stephania yunnanensis TaxID=152371 RepID=A0AAP0JL89_9MAGN